MSPAEFYRGGRRALSEQHIIHSLVIVIVVVAATLYAISAGDKSGNIWILYGAAIGSTGSAIVQSLSNPSDSLRSKNDK